VNQLSVYLFSQSITCPRQQTGGFTEAFCPVVINIVLTAGAFCITFDFHNRILIF
jgi:hypothetical protein